MSASTAVIVNAALGLSALGALAFVCRMPFRRGFETAVVLAAAPAPQAEYEQRAA